jgi:hypothetical protein
MHALHFSTLLLVSTSLSSNALAQVNPGQASEAAPPAPAASAAPAAAPAAAPNESAPAPVATEAASAGDESSAGSEGAAEPKSDCRPDCRAGFTCVEGQCASACNPPCGEGERCTDEITCEAQTIPLHSEAPADEQEAPMPEGLQDRIDARMKARFGLSLYYAAAGLSSAFISEVESVEDRARSFGGTGIAGAVSVRRHYHRYFGLQGRLLLGHYWLKGSFDGVDKVNAGGMTSILAEFTHLFGPFGRFYVGPSLGVGALIFDRSSVSLNVRDPIEPGWGETALYDTAVFTGGSDLGFHLGPKEEIDLNLRFRLGGVTKSPEPQSDFDMFYEAAVGIGYAL